NGSNMFSSGYSTFQILIIILSLSVLVSTEGGGATGSSPAASFGILALIGVLIYMLILTLVFPIFTSITLVHYNSLRCEKENFDIEKSIETIGKARAQNISATV
ncbi:MAG: hypothetical protein ACOC36_07415, partial [Fibrobacterota bacterium]